MSITGLPGQGPVRVGIPMADLTAGLFSRSVSSSRSWTARVRRGPVGRRPRCCRRRSPCSISRPRAGSSRARCRSRPGNHPTGDPDRRVHDADGHINIAASGGMCSGSAMRSSARIDATPRVVAGQRARGTAKRSTPRSTPLVKTVPWIELFNEAGCPADRSDIDPGVRRPAGPASRHCPSTIAELGFTMHALHSRDTGARTPRAVAVPPPAWRAHRRALGRLRIQLEGDHGLAQGEGTV